MFSNELTPKQRYTRKQLRRLVGIFGGIGLGVLIHVFLFTQLFSDPSSAPYIPELFRSHTGTFLAVMGLLLGFTWAELRNPESAIAQQTLRSIDEKGWIFLGVVVFASIAFTWYAQPRYDFVYFFGDWNPSTDLKLSAKLPYTYEDGSVVRYLKSDVPDLQIFLHDTKKNKSYAISYEQLRNLDLVGTPGETQFKIKSPDRFIAELAGTVTNNSCNCIRGNGIEAPMILKGSGNTFLIAWAKR